MIPSELSSLAGIMKIRIWSARANLQGTLASCSCMNSSEICAGFASRAVWSFMMHSVLTVNAMTCIYSQRKIRLFNDIAGPFSKQGEKQAATEDITVLSSLLSIYKRYVVWGCRRFTYSTLFRLYYWNKFSEVFLHFVIDYLLLSAHGRTTDLYSEARDRHHHLR